MLSNKVYHVPGLKEDVLTFHWLTESDIENGKIQIKCNEKTILKFLDSKNPGFKSWPLEKYSK